MRSVVLLSLFLAASAVGLQHENGPVGPRTGEATRGNYDEYLAQYGAPASVYLHDILWEILDGEGKSPMEQWKKQHRAKRLAPGPRERELMKEREREEKEEKARKLKEKQKKELEKQKRKEWKRQEAKRKLGVVLKTLKNLKNLKFKQPKTKKNLKMVDLDTVQGDLERFREVRQQPWVSFLGKLANYLTKEVVPAELGIFKEEPDTVPKLAENIEMLVESNEFDEALDEVKLETHSPLAKYALFKEALKFYAFAKHGDDSPCLYKLSQLDYNSLLQADSREEKMDALVDIVKDDPNALAFLKPVVTQVAQMSDWNHMTLGNIAESFQSAKKNFGASFFCSSGGDHVTEWTKLILEGLVYENENSEALNKLVSKRTSDDSEDGSDEEDSSGDDNDEEQQNTQAQARWLEFLRHLTQYLYDEVDAGYGCLTQDPVSKQENDIAKIKAFVEKGKIDEAMKVTKTLAKSETYSAVAKYALFKEALLKFYGGAKSGGKTACLFELSNNAIRILNHQVKNDPGRFKTREAQLKELRKIAQADLEPLAYLYAVVNKAKETNDVDDVAKYISPGPYHRPESLFCPPYPVWYDTLGSLNWMFLDDLMKGDYLKNSKKKEI